MELLPIGATLKENKLFADHPDCQTILPMTIEFFNRIGYTPPWIGYFAKIDDKIAGLSYRNEQVAVSPTFVVATLQNHDYRPLPNQNYHFLPTS